MSKNFSYLSFLKVSLRSNIQNGLIYANARNEVEVVVSFIALDDNGAQIFLSDSEINSSLSLCDYYTRESIERAGWHVGAGNGEFISDGILLDHYSRSSDTVDTLKLKSAGGPGYLTPQSFLLRVSVEHNVYATKSIAAMLFDGDKTTYDTANNGGYDSCVVLTPVSEKTYTTSDMFFCNSANIETVGGEIINTHWDINKHSFFYAYQR
ncbi:hypothetical protein [Pseudocitrobacter corydidari]|uniref:Uncharacterized protein n=1 Tax=Pseudocitrobacter corydidari TaxID=2891570 RepID=A0ABY3S959_9ENTR|nr:hypothetical protein [Pseudocitrobacter corydidari]UGS42160.1 hypothetical protein G163CM_28850 [Pseudocitrobacter corydidari]